MIRATGFLLLFLVCQVSIKAQNIYGTSDLQINSSNDTAAADCETDLDPDSDDGYYASRVSCVVKDQNGSVVASGSNSDDGDRNGFAEVNLSFSVTPGDTYTVTGTHSALLTTPFDTPTYPPSTTAYYFDEFNFFNYLESTDQDQADGYDFYGPEPERGVRKKCG